MKTFFNKNRLGIAGAIIGAAAGWCYWYFVGCSSGSCAITSSPFNSTLYGAMMGALGLSLLKDKVRDTSESDK